MKPLDDILEFAGKDTPIDKDVIDELGWRPADVFELAVHLYDKGYFGEEDIDIDSDFYANHHIFDQERLTLKDLADYLEYNYPLEN